VIPPLPALPAFPPLPPLLELDPPPSPHPWAKSVAAMIAPRTNILFVRYLKTPPSK